MTVLVIALTVVVAILVVLVAGLLRSHADILRALHGLGITEEDLDGGSARAASLGSAGSGESQGPAHDIVGVTPSGGTARAAVVATRHSTLLAFLSSGCLTCRDFWSAFAGHLELPGDDTRLVVVTQGPESESPGAVAELAPPGVRVLMSSEAWDAYGIPVAPYFLLVDGPSGEIIGEGAASTWESVVRLLGQALADGARRPAGGPEASRPGRGRTGGGRSTPRARARDAVRAADTDEVLSAAGIEPGDPRLYHEAAPAEAAAPTDEERS